MNPNSITSILQRTPLLACAGALLLLSPTAARAQGSLTPPSGPPTATMKSLQEIEPRVPIGSATTPGDLNSQFRIIAPGSYYVTGSLTVSSGRSFLEIAADNVTVDLNGCRLAGAAGSLSGIVLAGGVANVRLHNGTLADFDQDGIVASQASGVSLRHVTVAGVGGTAFRVGPGGEIVDCLAVNAGNTGFNLSDGAVAERCSAKSSGNGGGFFTGIACKLTRCVALQNGGSGFDAGSETAIISCTSVSNAVNGVGVVSGATTVRVQDCQLAGNGVRGIEATTCCAIEGNSIRSHSGQAQIHLTGRGNRVWNNHTYGTGVAASATATATNNVIASNFHLSSNGTTGWAGWDVAKNHIGPIVTNSGGIFLNANAWANFSTP